MSGGGSGRRGGRRFRGYREREAPLGGERGRRGEPQSREPGAAVTAPQFPIMAGAGASGRDKRATAARLKTALGGESGAAAAGELRALLERVLAPAAGLGGGEAAAEALEWCRCLLSGGEPWDSFVQAVRAYDPATLCGLVWTANFVAYRCRTCGISPCMSLCAECFHQGEHAGHDYNMFRSQAGGACDCGDSNVMREAG